MRTTRTTLRESEGEREGGREGGINGINTLGVRREGENEKRKKGKEEL